MHFFTHSSTPAICLLFGLLVSCPSFVHGSLGTFRTPSSLTRRAALIQSRHGPGSSTSSQPSCASGHRDEVTLCHSSLVRSNINYPSRGGQGADGLVRVVSTVTQILISCGKTVLPPIAAMCQVVVNFYRKLPVDVIIAQIGLVYCFCGGYYPTLFSALQAAQQCGLPIAIRAIQDLTNEAINVIDQVAAADQMKSVSRISNYREIYLAKTAIVLKTVDPVKINQATGAIYTTWLGVSSVLEREYARTIALSLTMAAHVEGVARFILVRPLEMCIDEDYHKWIPIVIGWASKAAAMNIAWRMQRVLTASTSAIAGGLMFSRAVIRIMSRHGIQFFGLVSENPAEFSTLDEIVGFAVGGFGLYTQIAAQYRSGFSFEVPWPINLVTWPFDWAEKWIQWQITKDPRE